MASNCNEGPPTPVRKSRRSWFDTPPLTSLDPKPTQNENVRPKKSKRKSLDTVETLTLTHFSSVPRLGFGNAVVGSTKFRTLLIRNPHEYEQEVIIEKFPFKKKFYVNHTRFDVAPGDVFKLEMTWTPEEAGGVREMILLHVNGVYRLQCFIFGTSENPKPVKKVRRGKIGPQVFQNSVVIQTPALTRIKSNYSPRRSQELRELQALVENKEFHHNHITPDSNVNNNTKMLDQLKTERSIRCEEINKMPLSGLMSENQRNRPDPVAMTPTPLESTSIGMGGKNEDESSSHGRNKWRNLGVASPSLTTMSPIPLSDGNENGITVDSYFRPSEVGFEKLPAKSRMKDTFIVPKPPFFDLQSQSLTQSKQKDNLTFADLQGNLSPGESKETTYVVPNLLSKAEVKEPKASVGNDSMSPVIMEVKRRVDWHTPQKANMSGNSSVSPNTILDQSLSLIAHTTLVENQIQSHCHDPDASINNSLISQGQGLVSPKSFMQDMKEMSFNDGTEKFTLKDHSFTENLSQSPSVVFNSSIPHNLMLQHLNSVRVSLSNSPQIQHKPVRSSKRRSLTSVYRAVERKTMITSKQSPKVINQRVRRTSGRLAKDNFNKVRGNLCDKPDYADSPRRETFIVQKKEKGNMKTIKKQSPLKKAKMLSPTYKQKRYSRRSSGKRNSPKIAKHQSQRLLNCSTPLKQSPRTLDSGTVVKNKSYNSPSSPALSSRYSDPISSPQFSAISPTCLPRSPSETEISRRATLTVTKSRPSDVLLTAMANDKRKKLFNQDIELLANVDESGLSLNGQRQRIGIERNRELGGEDEERKTADSSPSQFDTPNRLPTSPKPENSRRSTHVIRSPKVLDLSTLQQKCLNFDNGDEELRESIQDSNSKQEVEPPITSVCLMSPQIVDYEVTSGDSSQQSVSKDSLETSQYDDLVCAKNAIGNNTMECENRVDIVKAEFNEHTITLLKPLDREMKWSYCEEGDQKKKTEMSLNFDVEEEEGLSNDNDDEIISQDGYRSQSTDCVQNCIDKQELMGPPASVMLSKVCDEKIGIDSYQVSQQEQKAKRKLRRSASANEILSTVFNIDVSEFKTEISNCSQAHEDRSFKSLTKKENKWQEKLNDKTQSKKSTTKTNQTTFQYRTVRTASHTQLGSNGKEAREGNLRDLRGMSQSLTNINSKSGTTSNRVRQNQDKTISTKASVRNTDKTISVPKPGITKSRKGPVKGVAQSKLILVKKPKSAVARHPMPFAARNMYYDERWMEKQEKGFVQWLNFVLTPPEEYVAVTNKPKVDAVALSLGNQHVPARLAPTKEVLSFRAYAARRRLNRLRRAACQLYQSDSVVPVIHKVEVEVESRRIAVRKEKMVHADLGIRQRLLDLLLQYSSLWLRIGLETIFGEVIMLQSNTDVLGLSRFIVTRLLSCPDISAQYAHPSVPHLYTEGFAPALSRHTVKKFLLLVYFLDHAKSSKLIDHDPCLFCKDADIKCSKEILIQFSREVLSGEGDLNRHLAYLGYTVTHVQKPFDEFDYAVTNLSSDLKDGLRLCRVVELLAGDSFIMGKLRTPAISRLQKVHNMDEFFTAMSKRGMNLKDMSGSSARDVVEGHREKTLSVLWHLILHFQASVNVDEEKLKEEINLLKKSLGLKLAMEKIGVVYTEDCNARRDSGEPDTFVNNERMQLIFKWCRLVCLHYGVKIENMTVSFSDGRALCCLLHHYHPVLLPLSEIQFETSIRFQEKAEDLCDGEDPDLSVDWGKKGGLCPQEEDPAFFEQLLANEKSNFKVLYEKVSALGGIPLMVKHSDMSNTIPDEKVVSTYVSYLCARLLDIREEVRAARVIQMAWRRRRLQRTFKQRLWAVQLIQNSYRKHLKRKRAREEIAMAEEKQKMEELAIKVQALYKAFKERKHFLRMKAASLCLQSMWRMKKAKMLVALMKEDVQRKNEKEREKVECRAAELIQKTYRGYMVRRDVMLLKKCVTVLQSLWRMQQARMVVMVKRQEKEAEAKKQLEIGAAVCIQMVYRGFRVRRDLKHLRKCALVLQSLWRMQKGRMVAFEMREIRDREERDKREKEAAETIQKVFKGYRVRRDFRYLRKCAIVMQSLWRMQRAKLVLNMKRNEKERMEKEEREQEAAIRIQKNFRAFITRKEVKHLKRSVIVVQSLWRMQRAKCIVIKMRDEKQRLQKEEKLRLESFAALKIQKLYRGFKDRKELMQKKKCALVLQQFWRMQMAKKVLNVKRQEREKVTKEIKAATVIQSFVRRWICRVKYLKMSRGAICIQKNWRACLGRKIVAQMLKEEKSAAVIQKWMKGWFYRRLFQREKNAAIQIQRCWRTVLALRQVEKEEKITRAATTLQRYFKGYSCRQKYQRMRRAIICLQSLWRVRLAKKVLHTLQIERRDRASEVIYKTVLAYYHRKCYIQKRNAATVIQKNWRKVLARRELVWLRYFQEVNAAICIQSNYRAFVERERFMMVKKSAVTIQTWWRCCVAKQELIRLQTESRHKAVCVLQAFVKGSIQRQNFLRVKNAAVILQKSWRMKKAMAELEQLRLEKMSLHATVIQKSWRCYLVRKSYKEKRMATLFIQAQRRMNVQRRKYCLLKEATLMIQSSYRRTLLTRQQREEFLTQKAAAIFIQSAFKGAQARKEFQRKREAAICLQKNFRSFRRRTKFLALKYAAIIIQRAFRNVQLMKQARQEFLDMKCAAAVLQQMYEKNVQMRREYAAVIIQAAFRGFHVYRCYKKEMKAAIHIQNWFRGVQAMREERKRFLECKSSAITLQATFRMYMVRKEFCKKRNAVIILQAFARRIRAEEEFHLKRNATLIIQSYFRAWKMGKIFRQAFLLIKNSCVVIQRFYRRQEARRARAKLLCLQNTSASRIQACYKCHLQRKSYLALKSATLFLQNRCRSIQTGKAVRAEMKRRQNAAIAIQRRWKQLILIREAKMILEAKMEEARRFEEEKREKERLRKEVKLKNNAAGIIQQAWKQLKLIQEAKSILEEKRETRRIEEEKRLEEEKIKKLNAAIVIQQKWKQLKLIREAKLILEVKKEKRKVLLHQNMAASKCQAWYKMLCQRQKYTALKSYTLLIQRKFRGIQTGKAVRLEMKRRLTAALTIQTAWRSAKLIKEAKIILESKKEDFRKALEEERCRKEEMRKLREKIYEESQVKAAEILQKHARLFLCRLHERRIVAAATVLQKYVRGFIQRCRYKKDVQGIILIQSHARRLIQHHKFEKYKSMVCLIQQKRRKVVQCRQQRKDFLLKLKAISVIQSWYRKMKLAKTDRCATSIQALWRGYVVRRNITNRKLKQTRKRLEEVNRSVKEKDTLGSRTTSALDYLLTNKDMAYVLTALMHLEVGTRLSPVCCERLVEANAVAILVRLLNCCNRSVPHMEIIKYTIDILLNLAKYEKTVDSLLCVENTTAIILDLMQVYREKGAIFFKSCTLLGILARDRYRKEIILTCPNICERVQSMHSITVRKQRSNVKRQVTQAKFSAMKSFNCTLPVSTPSKSRQREIQPEWILSRRSNWKDFDDPLAAINFVMNSLQLGPK